MPDQTKTPHSEPPGEDWENSQPKPATPSGSGSGESTADSARAPGEAKSGSPTGRRSRTPKGTGAILSRITGVLRQAAEEAPGDPVIPLGAPDAGVPRTGLPKEESEPQADQQAPRTGTGQLNTMHSGVLRGSEDEAEPSLDPAQTGLMGTEAASAVDDLQGPHREEHAAPPQQATGHLESRMSGILRGADEFDTLRSEAMAKDPAPLPSEENWPSAAPDDDPRLADRFAMLDGEPPAADAEHVPPFVDAVESSEEAAPPEDAAGTAKPQSSLFTELRQTLAEEEAEQHKRGTGSFLRRITGTLRRSTGRLRKKHSEQEIEPDAAGYPGADEQGLPPAQPQELPEEAAAPTAGALPTMGEGWEEPIAPLGHEETGTWMRVQPEDHDEAGGDWMAELRQGGEEESRDADTDQNAGVIVDDSVEEHAPAQPERRSSRITGRLARIVTGLLSVPSARRKTPTQELDIPDELVTDRLRGSMPTADLPEIRTRALDREAVEEDGPRPVQEVDADASAPAAARSSNLEPRLRSGWDEDERSQRRPDLTGELRPFITGVLRGPEEPGGVPLADDLTDELVSDRLQHSLPPVPPRAPRRVSERRETFDAQSARRDVPDSQETSAAEDAPAEAATGPDIFDEALMAALMTPPPGESSSQPPTDQFGQFLGDLAATGSENVPNQAQSADRETAEPDIFSAEDIWGRLDASTPRTSDDSTWYVLEEDEETAAANRTLFGALDEEDEAAIFLTGQAAEQEANAPEKGPLSISDLRSIALEDYADPTSTGAGAAEDAQGKETAEAEPASGAVKPGLRARIAALSLVQKILLAEVVLVALLLPFLAFSTLRTASPQAQQPASTFPVPRALPAGVPYPTELTLTGGWHFPLQKSTFVEGKWVPAGSEWLEGTEVRRVVALPWNRQTDAVARSLEQGDVISLILSNGDEVQYKVITVERRDATDADFLADRRLSLVILLYSERSNQRWVIIGER